MKYQSKSIVNDGECGKCDDVKDGFYTERIKVDTVTGTTYCSVHEYTSGKFVGYANKTVKSCAYINSKEAKNAEKEYKEMLEATKKNNGIKSSIGNTQKNNSGGYNSSEINFSHFIAGLLTLDPNIIDRSSNEYGEIILKKPIKGGSFIQLLTGSKEIKDHLDQVDINTNAGTDTNFDDWIQLAIKGKNGGINSIIATDTFDALDAFNKINMQYFNDLFANMDQIYIHIQILIFILVGGFFVMQIGASKIQTNLAYCVAETQPPYPHQIQAVFQSQMILPQAQIHHPSPLFALNF